MIGNKYVLFPNTDILLKVARRFSHTRRHLRLPFLSSLIIFREAAAAGENIQLANNFIIGGYIVLLGSNYTRRHKSLHVDSQLSA
jgi:hypothetical protein